MPIQSNIIADEYKKAIVKRVEELSRLFSLHFKIENLEGLARKNKLNPLQIDLIKKCAEALEETYPDRWDIHFELVPTFKTFRNTYGSNHVQTFPVLDHVEIRAIYLVVWFPEVTISNSRGRSVVIKDLFTRIRVSLGGLYGSRQQGCDGLYLDFSSLEGTRSSQTLVEYRSRYFHSHLPSRDLAMEHQKRNFTVWDSFCTGDGDINSARSLLCSGFDKDLLKLYLFQIDSFVRWESLEGGPYMNFSNVANKTLIPVFGLGQAKRLYEYISFRRRIVEQPLDWKLVNGTVEIVDNEKFEEFFRSSRALSNCADYFFYKDENGEYYSSASMTREIFEPSKEWIPFRGQKIRFIVEGEYRSVETQKYVHPQIKSYVKKRLEQKVNSTRIRKNLIKQ